MKALYRFCSIFLSLLSIAALALPALAQGDLGGDDVLLDYEFGAGITSMDIASNGDIYIANSYATESLYFGFRVFRSQDGGTTWDLWGALDPPPGGPDNYRDPCLRIAEGLTDRCYVTYQFFSNDVLVPDAIRLVSSDLSATTADFSTEVTVMEGPVAREFVSPRMEIDDSNYSDFYIYIVAPSRDYSPGVPFNEVWFARSTDLGASFEAPYMIAETSVPNYTLKDPDISFGFGDLVHVVWQWTLNGGSNDGTVFYRRASNSVATPGDWGPVSEMIKPEEGLSSRYPCIKASSVGNDVVVAYSRSFLTEDDATYHPAVVAHSADAGGTFTNSALLVGGARYLSRILEEPVSGQWTMGGSNREYAGIHRASVSDFSSWSGFEIFSDTYTPGTTVPQDPDVALDPTRGHRVAMTWAVLPFPVAYNEGLFDAEWRADPGYPNLEPGFPVTLDTKPLSPPALADLNGDGDLEVVWGDIDGYIQVYQKDGSVLPGWPVEIPNGLSEGPIAVGDLMNNGQMSVVAGSADGLVYCFDGDGAPAAGNWPVGTPGPSPAFAAVGSFGQGPYPRGIVSISGNDVAYLDFMGRPYPGTVTVALGRVATHAPAIGDVDGDGLPDAVFACGDLLVVDDMFAEGILLGKYLPGIFSASPALGDFQLDNALDVVVPLTNGSIHVYDENGTELPGFPFTSPGGVEMTGIAVAHFLGAGEPEIVATNRNEWVHLILEDGTEGMGYPVSTGSAANTGGAIIGPVGTGSDAVIQGSPGQKAWAWSNLGVLLTGWPKALGGDVTQTAAMGDIDQDGSFEVAFLIQTPDLQAQLAVVDVNTTVPAGQEFWAMAGYDAQRRSCYYCFEDLVTPVNDDPDVITRVSFAPPSPNPSSGSANFHFSIPARAVVNLEVFDVRGHRVSLVTREETESGHHVATWNGRGEGGRVLASGTYFARLRVQGPGIQEELTRKITLAR